MNKHELPVSINFRYNLAHSVTFARVSRVLRSSAIVERKIYREERKRVREREKKKILKIFFNEIELESV